MKLDIFTYMLYLKFKISVCELNILKIIFSIFETQIAVKKKKKSTFISLIFHTQHIRVLLDTWHLQISISGNTSSKPFTKLLPTHASTSSF